MCKLYKRGKVFLKSREKKFFMLVEKRKVIPRKNTENPRKIELYTKLSTISPKKYHKCGIKEFVSRSKVCFGICDKITKKDEKRKNESESDNFGQK